MIWGAFTSEWTKLRRPTLFFGTYLGLATAASLFSVLLFVQAPSTSGGDLPSLSQLAQANGLIHGLDRATVLLGVVAFGIAAAQIASEYSLGTMRQALVRQPRRPIFLAGKYLAVVTFLIGAVVFAAAVAAVVAVSIAHGRHVSTAAWFSGAGIGDLTRALGDLVLAVIGYATLGLTVGLFLRSAVFAVIAGLAWLIAIENIITRIVSGATDWLPGALLQAIGQGGTATLGLGRAVATSTVYLVIVGIATVVVFTHKDITA
jgi:ABC-2 type transport system permease protein